MNDTTLRKGEPFIIHHLSSIIPGYALPLHLECRSLRQQKIKNWWKKQPIVSLAVLNTNFSGGKKFSNAT
ncbi:MAG: hypothetical protein EP344_07920 [Bacteroidetes bacterium]|nr:MAG: hypothetical protein EP344_07920 [Bacteroidota bacterium]